MKWYPWLNETYQKILSIYQQGREYQVLLIHSQPGIGEESLCYAISRWLICNKRNGIKSCGICNNCCLMKVGNHPDYYLFNVKKNKILV